MWKRRKTESLDYMSFTSEHTEEASPFWGGEPDEIFTETCSKCGHCCNPDESVKNEETGEWTCCNCLPPELPPESDLFKFVKAVSKTMAAQYRQRREPMGDV